MDNRLRTLTTILGALALFAAGVVAGVAWARLLDDDGAAPPTTATTTTTVPATTTTVATTAPPTTVPSTYVVQAGDTLTKIAARFGTTVAAIVALNQLENPDRLSEGQVLKIPPPTTAPPLTTVAPG